jgi:type IV pilus assembly protein PilF
MFLCSRKISFFGILAFLFAFPGCATPDPTASKKRVRALEDLGVSHFIEGKPNLAVKYLIEAAEADPKDAQIAHSLGLVYRDLGIFDSSIAEFRRALALKVDFPQAVNNMGVTYLVMGRVDDAISCFKKAAAIISYATPHYAFLNLGLAYYQKHEYTCAINYYKKALRIDSSFVIAYENLGLAYEAVGEWEQAWNAYQSSISHEPDSPNAYLLLGKLHRRLGQRAEAVEVFQKAVAKDPDGWIGREALQFLKELGVIPTGENSFKIQKYIANWKDI